MHRVDEPLVIMAPDNDILGFVRQLGRETGHRLGFRGHARSDWLLYTSIARYFLKLPIEMQHEHQSYRRVQRALLSKFKEGLLTNGDLAKEVLEDTEIWEYGQHYGLPTPLLDWSYSPYVAVYFAARDVGESAEHKRAVWVLDLDLLDLINSQLSRLRSKKQSEMTAQDIDNRFGGVEVQRSPSWFNRRLTYQQGFFTRHPYFLNFEIWLRNVSSDLGFAWDAPLLRKVEFILTEENQARVMSELNLMNVNSRVLFPDIKGSAEHACDLVRYERRPKVVAFSGGLVESENQV